MISRDAHELALREQLAAEARICPQCRFAISSPFMERCPRCFTPVPRGKVDCAGCFHKAICPVVPPKP